MFITCRLKPYYNRKFLRIKPLDLHVTTLFLSTHNHSLDYWHKDIETYEEKHEFSSKT
ncbi:hypothetical protein HanPSC8_Chr05g0188811 [Helianthus annuus]|nr:hypothetical protein HanPSC8_Chr05g0188811 [Helianthus annuus]